LKVEKYKNDLDQLINRGEKLYLAMILAAHPEKTKLKASKELLESLPSVSETYQAWYSEALACVQQLLPDRVEDFAGYYKPVKGRKDIDASNYTISDYLRGLGIKRGGQVIVGPDSAIPAMEQQMQIVKALHGRFESSLFDIKVLVQADLLDDELASADELVRNGYARAAGALAGVALEGHLATVAERHRLAYRTNASIGDLNDTLKNNDVFDTATWRFIQRLGDLRNLCSHKKTEDPTKESVKELIDGVKKIIKTVF